MRRLGVTAGLGMALGCTSSSVFICADDGQCGSGRCEVTGYCSFPDDTCASGYAYGQLSAPALMGTCVGGDAPAETDVPATTETTLAETSSSGPPDPTNAASSSPTAPSTSSAVETYGDVTYGGETYGYDTGYETGDDPAVCIAYAQFMGMCYDRAEYALEYCSDAYAYYAGYYGEECTQAFIDHMACLSALDCGDLQSMIPYCQEEQDVFNMLC